MTHEEDTIGITVVVAPELKTV